MNIFVMFFLLLVAQWQKSPVDIDNVPTLVSECLKPRATSLEVSRRMNPFYQRADFNGDGLMDYVVLVQEKKSQKQGFAFCFQGSQRKLSLVGAGTPLALEGGITRDDLSEFDVWGVIQSGSKARKNDALYLEKAESGSGVLIWNGSKMMWQQRGI